MKRPILLLLFLSIGFSSFSQSNPRYFVLFKDKAGSPYSITAPKAFLSEKSIARRTKQKISVTENDLPVNPAYIAAIKQTGAIPIFPSRWFNGLVVEASATQLDAIKKLSFYKGIELNLPIANIGTKSPGIERSMSVADKFGMLEDVDYGKMRDQLALMGVEKLHQKRFPGRKYARRSF